MWSQWGAGHGSIGLLQARFLSCFPLNWVNCSGCDVTGDISIAKLQNLGRKSYYVWKSAYFHSEYCSAPGVSKYLKIFSLETPVHCQDIWKSIRWWRVSLRAASGRIWTEEVGVHRVCLHWLHDRWRQALSANLLAPASRYQLCWLITICVTDLFYRPSGEGEPIGVTNENV